MRNGRTSSKTASNVGFALLHPLNVVVGLLRMCARAAGKRYSLVFASSEITASASSPTRPRRKHLSRCQGGPLSRKELAELERVEHVPGARRSSSGDLPGIRLVHGLTTASSPPVASDRAIKRSPRRPAVVTRLFTANACARKRSLQPSKRTFDPQRAHGAGAGPICGPEGKDYPGACSRGPSWPASARRTSCVNGCSAE